MKRSKSRVACKELKSALLQALKLVGKGVDEFPIAGVKGCISGVLKIIEKRKASYWVKYHVKRLTRMHSQLRKANMQTFNGLVDIIILFEKVIARLSEDRNLLDGVKSNIECFAKCVQC